MTRDVALGKPGLNGDYLINAQGEDVVAGLRTPQRIEETLAKVMPALPATRAATAVDAKILSLLMLSPNF